LTKLDDFLAPLHQGVWEVIVPKEEVSEPLGDKWIMSRVNLPSPETIASYRKGRYHCHETKSDWRVHLDLYDPSRNPIMHLVDDAPLILLMAGTLESLWVDAKNTRKMDLKELLEEHKTAWQLLFLIGTFFLIIGTLLIINTHIITAFFIVVGLPAAIIGFAIFMIYLGGRTKPFNAIGKRNIVIGVSFIIIGLMALKFPVFLIFLLVMFVAVWPISSAFVSLKRTAKGKLATPDGFKKRLAIGIVSVVMVILFILWPLQTTMLIIDAVSVIIVFMGILYLLRAFGARSALKAFGLENGSEETGFGTT
jgi:uncharacterized membrane protein HdeD (DUF308 family)